MLYDDVYDGLKSDFKKGKIKSNTSFFVYVFLFFLIGVFILGILLIRKPHSSVADFDNLPEPFIEPMSGSVDLKIYGHELHFDFLESYDLNGKVIAVNKPRGMSDFSVRLSPKNFVLGWGMFGIQENIDMFKWQSDDVSDVVLYPVLIPGNEDQFHDSLGIDSYSNIRFIASDKKIRFLLNKIDVGDYVRVKGYLAQVRYSDDTRWRGPSCVSRLGQKCDVIYVTDVSWLKES